MPRFFSFLLISTWLLVQPAAAQPLPSAKRNVLRTQAADRVTIALADGQLVLRPLAENAIRVQFTKDIRATLPELVLTSPAVPAFKVTEMSTAVQLATKQVKVLVDTRTNTPTRSRSCRTCTRSTPASTSRCGRI